MVHGKLRFIALVRKRRWNCPALLIVVFPIVVFPRRAREILYFARSYYPPISSHRNYIYCKKKI